MQLCHGWGWWPPQTASHIHSRHIKCLGTLICCLWLYSISLTQFYPPYLAQMLGFWVTCGVKMILLCHGWGWQPPQTASHIHIRDVQSVWAHWYAVHWHMVVALHIHNHCTWLRFLGTWSLVELKWCDYVKVDADSHLKLLPISILDIISVWAHWYAVHRHIVAALHSYTHTPWRHLPPCPRCCPCCTGVGSCKLGLSIALASSLSLCWYCCPHCAGIAALVVLALLPLLHWCLLSAMRSTTSSAA